MGWTTSPVTGAAIHRTGMFSSLAPSVSKIRLTLAFCSAKPIWMPRKPKLMFQISQNVRRGLGRRATGAVAADDPMVDRGLRDESEGRGGDGVGCGSLRVP